MLHSILKGFGQFGSIHGKTSRKELGYHLILSFIIVALLGLQLGFYDGLSNRFQRVIMK